MQILHALNIILKEILLFLQFNILFNPSLADPKWITNNVKIVVLQDLLYLKFFTFYFNPELFNVCT